MSDTNNTTEAPAGEGTAFDEQFNAFLGHSFQDAGDVIEGEAITGEDTKTATGGEATQVAPTGQDTIAGDAGNDTTVSPSASDSSQQASGTDIIDPALLAEMAGLAGPPIGADTTSAPEGGQTTEGAAPTSQIGEAFMPFTPTFDLPPAVVSGLFEAEDTETRQKALVGVLSAFGNTTTSIVAQYVEKRIAEVMDARENSRSEANVGQAVTQHFYGKYPELGAYKPAVVRAFQVLAGRNKGASYSEEIADQVARLAKAALAQSGVKLEEKKAPAKTPLVKAPVKKAPGSAFEAGGSRPGGGLETEPDSGPADLVAQMRDFGF